MEENLGMGVMLGILGGNKETVDTIKSSLGKIISKVWLDEYDKLRFVFTDGVDLCIWDDGQSCCEHRYMKTDDYLGDFDGATILDFELRDVDGPQDKWGEHEIQFLEIKTNKGSFQMSNHNEHNGYYG